MRICLIANPAAGHGRHDAALTAARERLAQGAEVSFHRTGERGRAEEIARSLRPGEVDAVVVAGGDGTINEVVNGLDLALPVGLLPMGTANVLARELRIPLDPGGACEVLLAGRARPIDLGRCNGRRFVLMAGIGFDAAAVRDVPPDVKNLIGAPAYVISGLAALAQIRPRMRYRLETPEGRLSTRGMMLVVANAASYAGPLQIAPMASIDDGELDLCLFRPRSRLAFVGQLLRVLFRRLAHDPRILFRRTARVRVACDPPAAVQLDGDYFGRTPVEVEVLPAALRVIRPS